MLLACMWLQYKKEACTKLVQRISCLGVVLAGEQGGAHVIGTANFVLQGARLRGHAPRRGKARTKLAQRISCAEVLLPSEPSCVGVLQHVAPAQEGEGAHEIGTPNFVHRGAPACVKRGELRGDAPSMWLQYKQEACTKLVQRISCLGVVLGARTKLAQRISCFRLRSMWPQRRRGSRARSSWPERGAAWGCSLHAAKLAQRSCAPGLKKELRGGAPGMWPQQREGKARTKLVQRISYFGVVVREEEARQRISCADAPGRGEVSGCSEGVTANFVLAKEANFVRTALFPGQDHPQARNSLYQFRALRLVGATSPLSGPSAHEIRCANLCAPPCSLARTTPMLLACGPSPGGKARTKVAQRISSRLHEAVSDRTQLVLAKSQAFMENCWISSGRPCCLQASHPPGPGASPCFLWAPEQMAQFGSCQAPGAPATRLQRGVGQVRALQHEDQSLARCTRSSTMLDEGGAE